MSAYESDLDVENPREEDNVVMFRPRARKPRHDMAETRRSEVERREFETRRYPVDIRGDIAFGRLMSGLSTVGLTARVDAQSGRVVITDEIDE